MLRSTLFLANITLGEVEEFWLPAEEEADEPVQGWILKPPNFNPEKHYPLLLQIHGGPAAAYGYGWFHEFQCFAAQGYVVVYTNPHGSQGYGEEFATCIVICRIKLRFSDSYLSFPQKSADEPEKPVYHE